MPFLPLKERVQEICSKAKLGYKNVTTVFDRTFMKLHEYCQTTASNLSFAFVLGVYVDIVFDRWRGMFVSIPFSDRTAVLLAAHLKGQDDTSRAMRRTIIRYLMLGYTLAMRTLCTSVKKRFPTMTHLTIAGNP